MEITIQVGQEWGFQVVGTSSRGSDVPLDTQDQAPAYTNSNPGAADLSVNPDGLSGKIRGLSPGRAVLGCDPDADLDAGEVRLVHAELTVNVLPEEAASAEFRAA